jgi:hypothetical protein
LRSSRSRFRFVFNHRLAHRRCVVVVVVVLVVVAHCPTFVVSYLFTCCARSSTTTNNRLFAVIHRVQPTDTSIGVAGENHREARQANTNAQVESTVVLLVVGGRCAATDRRRHRIDVERRMSDESLSMTNSRSNGVNTLDNERRRPIGTVQRPSLILDISRRVAFVVRRTVTSTSDASRPTRRLFVVLALGRGGHDDEIVSSSVTFALSLIVNVLLFSCSCHALDYLLALSDGSAHCRCSKHRSYSHAEHEDEARRSFNVSRFILGLTHVVNTCVQRTALVSLRSIDKHQQEIDQRRPRPRSRPFSFSLDCGQQTHASPGHEQFFRRSTGPRQ